MASGSWYREGVVQVTNGSKFVDGTESYFKSNEVAQVGIGDVFTVDFSNSYEIIAIESDTKIVLDREYQGPTSETSYAILRNSSGNTNSRLANQVVHQFNQKQLLLNEWQAWTNSTQSKEIITDSYGVNRQVLTLNSFESRAEKAIEAAEGASEQLEVASQLLNGISFSANAAYDMATDADGLILEARDTAINYATHAVDEFIPETTDYSALHYSAQAGSFAQTAKDHKDTAETVKSSISGSLLLVNQAKQQVASDKEESSFLLEQTQQKHQQVNLLASQVTADKVTTLSASSSALSNAQNAAESKLSAQAQALMSQTNAEHSNASRLSIQLLAEQVEADKVQTAQDRVSSMSSASDALQSKNQVEELRDEAEEFKNLAQSAAGTVTGALFFGGDFDASTGFPPLKPANSSVFYKVIATGNIDGIDYEVNDSIVYHNQTDKWFKIDNTEQVTSVNGKKGAVALTPQDIGAARADHTHERDNTWRSISDSIRGIDSNISASTKALALAYNLAAGKLPAGGTAVNSSKLDNKTKAEVVSEAVSASVGRGEFRSWDSIVLNDSAITSKLIAQLTSIGMFNYNHATAKVTWDYYGNSDLTDTGFGAVELAGCVIETFKNNACKHVRLTRPTTGKGDGMILLYNDQGSSYLPGWRKIYNSSTPPTAEEVGALPIGGTSVNSSKVGGYSISSGATGNTVAVRTTSGDLVTRLVRSSYHNESRMLGGVAFRVNNGSDNYTRFCSSPTAFMVWMQSALDSRYNRIGWVGIGGATTGSGCFALGTKIMLANGLETTMDTLRVGDVVAAFEHSELADESESDWMLSTTKDINKGVISTAEVAQVIFDSYKQYYVINGDLKATFEHPFLVFSPRFNDWRWLKTQDLNIGDKVLSLSGDTLEIESLQLIDKPLKTVNINVETLDNYFVYLNGKFVLAHNTEQKPLF